MVVSIHKLGPIYTGEEWASWSHFHRHSDSSWSAYHY